MPDFLFTIDGDSSLGKEKSGKCSVKIRTLAFGKEVA